jgi:hypothetical protein
MSKNVSSFRRFQLEGTDGRNPPRRFHKDSRVFGSYGSVGRLLYKHEGGSKLSKGRAIYPSQSGSLDPSRDRLSWFREKRVKDLATRIAILQHVISRGLRK